MHMECFQQKAATGFRLKAMSGWGQFARLCPECCARWLKESAPWCASCNEFPGQNLITNAERQRMQRDVDDPDQAMAEMETLSQCSFDSEDQTLKERHIEEEDLSSTSEDGGSEGDWVSDGHPSEEQEEDGVNDSSPASRGSSTVSTSKRVSGEDHAKDLSGKVHTGERCSGHW